MKHLILFFALTVAVFAGKVETALDLVPSSTTDVVTTTVKLRQVVLNNKSAATVYCSVLDRQGTPMPIFGDGANSTVGAVSAGTVYIMNFPEAVPMSGGIKWSCSSGTAVVGSMVYDR